MRHLFSVNNHQLITRTIDVWWDHMSIYTYGSNTLIVRNKYIQLVWTSHSLSVVFLEYVDKRVSWVAVNGINTFVYFSLYQKMKAAIAYKIWFYTLMLKVLNNLSKVSSFSYYHGLVAWYSMMLVCILVIVCRKLFRKCLKPYKKNQA